MRIGHYLVLSYLFISLFIFSVSRSFSPSNSDNLIHYVWPLSLREVIKLKKEQKSLDHFDDHLYAYGTVFQLCITLRGNLRTSILCCKRILTVISQVIVVSKYTRALNSGKAREVHFSLPRSSLQQPHVLISSPKRKSERCPDPNERVDKNTNREFPDKIVAI